MVSRGKSQAQNTHHVIADVQVEGRLKNRELSTQEVCGQDKLGSSIPFWWQRSKRWLVRGKVNLLALLLVENGLKAPVRRAVSESTGPFPGFAFGADTGCFAL